MTHRAARGLALCIALLPGVASSAPATSGADAGDLAKELTRAMRKVEGARAAASQAHAKVKQLAAQRKTNEPVAQALAREVSAHLQKAKALEQKYALAEKARKQSAPPTPTADLMAAQAELASTLSRAGELQQSAQALGLLEAELDKAAGEALAAAADAQQAARDATTAAQRLAQLAKDSKTLAGLVDQEGRGARADSGLALASAYQDVKARREREAKALAASVDVAKTLLARVNDGLGAAKVSTSSAASNDAKTWRSIYPASPARTPPTKLSRNDEAALLKRFFPKSLAEKTDCPNGWGPGEHSNDEARAAGMFKPQVLASLEGPFTRRGAKERLLWVRVNECTGAHVEGYGTARLILVEGARTVINQELFGLSSIDLVDDLDGDGVLELTQVSSDMHQGMTDTSVSLSSLSGGKLHDLESFGGESDPCAAGEELVGNDAERSELRVLARSSPKLEFKTEEKKSRCFEKPKRRGR